MRCLSFGDRQQSIVLFLEGERLREHYAELDKRVEAVRDRLLALTKCCHKGFDGLYEEALEEIDWSASGDGDSVEGVEEKKFIAGENGFDVFEAVRQRNVEDGILTDMGREQGFVALQSCPFYGRLVGEIIYTFNDALRRMEDRTGFYVAGGWRYIGSAVLRGTGQGYAAAAGRSGASY